MFEDYKMRFGGSVIDLKKIKARFWVFSSCTGSHGVVFGRITNKNILYFLFSVPQSCSCTMYSAENGWAPNTLL